METLSPTRLVPATDPPGSGTPTVLRFSRRMGESVRGADYAQAIHPPPRGKSALAYGCVVVAAATAAAALALTTVPVP